MLINMGEGKEGRLLLMVSMLEGIIFDHPCTVLYVVCVKQQAMAVRSPVHIKSVTQPSQEHF